jgi:ABC-type uncharacterized transport system substrate-binding protein
MSGGRLNANVHCGGAAASATGSLSAKLNATKKAQTLDVDVYDPTFFVAFSFADKDPVALAAAPPQCTFAFNRPPDMTSAAQGQPLGEAFFNQLDASANWGAQFASKISVKCP